MAMAVDNRHQMSGLPYEQMRYQGPQFTNPWVATSGAPPGGQMYVPSMAQAAAAHQQPHHHSAATAAAAAMPYQNSSLPSLAVPPGYARQYAADYPPSAAASSSSSAAAAANYTTATAGSSYAGSEYAATAHAQQQQQQPQQHKLSPYPTFQDRRASHPLHAATEAERSSFNDALDASRGMVAMSQDITPRNIYGHNGSTRSSTDSYGFPSTHSSHSSISSASTHPSTYYGSSVSEASYGDYSSANESVDMPSRALPRSGMAALPPNPSSMMGQFSSKVSSSSQKKHKCKVCDKRFTRPSSLQTHMYSHTGEKPFACDVDGCGRHFSVVSNLRRHKKVHKADGDHASPDDE